jgi:phage tail-like protein
MPARDANNAAWFVLRYAEDFAPRPNAPADASAPFLSPSSPFLEPSLLHDARRGVLELQPEAAATPARPPSGLALDIDGDIFCIDADGRLVVERCDGSRAPVVCEPGVLAQPAGLALDRRGFLYVADPAARRVVVLSPGEGSAQAILGGGGPVGPLDEPIDVAVAPDGRIYVADRAGGRIAVFSAGMRPLGAFATAAAAGQAASPVAVAVDADGAILVADAYLPRLLRYAPDGERLADADLRALAAPLAGGALALGAYQRAYCDCPPRFLVGVCGPCLADPEDAGARLAEVHLALRVLALTLGRRFARFGRFFSRALDAGQPGVLWHRVELEFAEPPPPGAQVLVETFTSESAAPGEPTWLAPTSPSGALAGFTPDVPDQIVMSPRGRYLWLRVTLASPEGTATPSLSAIRVYYPRVSWLDLLPSAYRRDPDAAWFMDRFLALFEHVFTRVEDRYEAFSRQLDPAAAPRDIIDWLGALIDLSFDPSWPLARRRALVLAAAELYRKRGTVAGLELYVEIYAGQRPVIVEAFRERPGASRFLGVQGPPGRAGLALAAAGEAESGEPEAALWARYAHRFTIFVYLAPGCDAETTLRAIDRIVEVNKPAHTAHRLEPIYPAARVGLQSRVGLDLVLGAEAAPRVEIGGASGDGGVLGLDSVLGARRPNYVRRLDDAL